MSSHSAAPTPSDRGPVAAILTRGAIVRLLLGWASVGAITLAAPLLAVPLSSAALVLVLAAIVAVIVVAAGGVVQQAEALARRLGDPYGTLVLTLSIVVIEVVLIAAVMQGPGDHATIARDSVMAVSMIIMNLVLGLCLLVGGLRHGSLAAHRVGTSAYLVMLVALSALAFALPATLGAGGSYAPAQALVIAGLTVALYAVFLWRQTGAQAAEFQEVTVPAAGAPGGRAPVPDDGTAPPPLRQLLAVHRAELLARSALLIATVLPIVLLSHHMADLLDDASARLGAPAALGGVLIALIVFTPESITAVRAALAGEVQRVVNLCHGALVSTLALTIPTVLVIGLLTGAPVVLAASPPNLLLLAATLAVAAISAAAPRMTALHGAVHLLLFGVYALMLFR
ncbi:calcium:proton antiporter [Brachybacterium vulturis]|uniref:Calcium:proton antiporter n=1 Tax=Brachybacterium vulturis TaxID=2017484 RepID=A0A291GLZ3_9MICO|nr:calcium:proton antiporter [Brachybacterium vulturis]ATG51197.1 calcium:proton antiporter [Brachybacterium vulturis]